MTDQHDSRGTVAEFAPDLADGGIEPLGIARNRFFSGR